MDSGDPEQVQQVLDRGYTLHKITTNPSTISKTIARDGGRVRDVVERIIEIAPNIPISVETIGTRDYDPAHMDPQIFFDEAVEITNWGHPNLVVKLPTVPAGLIAARLLSKLDNGPKINFTLVFSDTQALCAADYGAAYVSPFVGRYDAKVEKLAEAASSGMDLVRRISRYYNRIKSGTNILTASTRNRLEYVEQAADIGSHYITMPPEMFEAIDAKGGPAWLEKVSGRARPFVPKNPDIPSYQMTLDQNSMRNFEIELLGEGVKKFLSDAQSVGYRIL